MNPVPDQPVLGDESMAGISVRRRSGVQFRNTDEGSSMKLKEFVDCHTCGEPIQQTTIVGGGIANVMLANITAHYTCPWCGTKDTYTLEDMEDK